jgi:Tol biopolymer transport system component
MTSFERFETRLPAMLDDLAVPRLPDYADDLFARTAATRQRPGWTFPERWRFMSAITRPFALAPRVPLRVGVALALLTGAAIIGLLVAGSRLSRVPPPFGPASNGVLPYMSNGNLYIGDLTTGTTRLLLDGSADMGLPQFSPDGTRLAFLNVVPGTSPESINVTVIRGDGSGATVITPHPIVNDDWKWIGWTPDSQRIAIIYTVDGINQLDLVDASGNGSVQRLAAAAGLTALTFRPPDGREILFRGIRTSAGTYDYGLYVMNADGSNVRRLAEPAVADDTLDLTSATYTPDGKRIFYNRWTSDASAGDPGCCQLFVMNADGSDQHRFILNPGTAWDGDAKVSPDGTWIAFWHHGNEAPNHGVFVIRADGTGPLIETGPPISGTAHWVWAPDSSKILMYMNDLSNSPAYVLDPEGGEWTTTPWNQDNDIDWQRLALPQS